MFSGRAVAMVHDEALAEGHAGYGRERHRPALHSAAAAAGPTTLCMMVVLE